MNNRRAVLAAICGFAALYPSTPTRAELLGYWTFDTDADTPATVGTTSPVSDVSGKGYNGTLQVATGTPNLRYSTDVPPELAGATSRSLDLTTADHYVKIDAPGAINAFNMGNSFTVGVWVKTWPTVNWVPWVAKGGDTGNGLGTAQGFQVRRFSNTNDIGFTTRGAGDDLQGADVAGEKAAQRWQHVCVTFDGLRKSIYVNGVHARTQTLTGAAAVVASIDPVTFGCRFLNGSVHAGSFSRPRLDNIAIFNHVLTAAEIEQLAGGVDPRFDPVNGRFGLSKQTYPWGYGELWGVPGAFGYRELRGTGAAGSGSTVNSLGDVRFAMRNRATLAGFPTAPVDVQNMPRLSLRDPQSGAGSGNTATFQNFLTNTTADDNHFFYTATGCIRIPAGASQDNKWTFWYAGDDGAELVVYGGNFESTIGNATEHVSGEHAMNGLPTGNTNTFATITLPPGDYNIRHTWMEKGGGAWSELWLSPGTKTSFDGAFRLVGDTATGGVELVHHTPIVDLTTTTPLVIAGNPANVVLRYDQRFATTATIDNGVGAVTGNNGTITLPAPATTTTYTLTGTHQGNTSTSQVTIFVDVPPPITSFTIDDNTLAPGIPMTLRWVTQGATSVSINNGAPAISGASGSVTFPAPAATTTYTLTATNSIGSTTAQVTVTIGNGPTIDSFTLADSTVPLYGPVQLNWATSNADTVSISPNIGAVASSGQSFDIPEASTTYTLTATNGFASVTATAAVTIPQPIGITSAGWTVNQHIANNGTPPINSLAAADALANGTNRNRIRTATGLQRINIGPGGEFPNDELPTPLEDGDHFTMISTATLQVNLAGNYVFGINNDDGGRLRVDGNNVIVDDANHGRLTTRSVEIPLTAGTHTIEYLFFEQTGGMGGEVFWYPGPRPLLLSPVASLTPPTTTDLIISEFLTSNQNGIRDAQGERHDWIEIFNGTAAPINLEGYFLTDDASIPNRWDFPAYTLQPGAYLLVFASLKDTTFGTNEFHTNFRLEQDGEHLGLYKSNGMGGYVLVDGFTFYPRQADDIAYGRYDTELFTGYLSKETPGGANFYGGFVGITGDTNFDVNRRFFTAPFVVNIGVGTGYGDQTGTIVRYTLDGSAPTFSHGTIYTAAIPITETTVLRAAAFKPGFMSRNIDTNTYIRLDDVITQTANTAIAKGFPAGAVNTQVYRYGMNSAVVNSNPQGVKDALNAIPTISIVVDQKDFSDPVNGVYSNPNVRGEEVPCSVELLNEGALGEGHFQINAGLRIRGGFSRSPSNPKHAFRFFFNDDYDGALNYPLFKQQGQITDVGATRFEKMDLRTSQNYSWAFQNDPKNTMLREEISRDLQGNTGNPYSRCRYFHVYVNGIYWGLYDTDERYEATFGEAYFGGDEDDYDTIKSAGNANGYNTEATDGFFDFVKNPNGTNGPRSAWGTLWDRTRATRSAPATGDAVFYQLQGLSPDGVTPHPTDKPLLDVDNLIDYLLVTWYCGSFDAPMSTFLNEASNNWFALRNRTGNFGGFRFAVHDFEHGMGTDVGTGTGFNQTFNGGFHSGVANDQRSLDRIGPWGLGDGAINTGANPATGLEFNYKGQRTYESINNFLKSNPQYLHEDLVFSSPEYRVRVWDRVHKHFFNSGALTDAKVIEQINKRATTVNAVMLAEQARWGNTTNLTVNAYNQARGFLVNWVLGGSNQTAGSNPPSPGTPPNGIGRTATIVRLLRDYKDGVSASQSPPGASPNYIARPLYPLLNAPNFSQFGGVVPTGYELIMTIPASTATPGVYQNTLSTGQIYYTKNGQDPRLIGGAVNGTASVLSSGDFTNLTGTTVVKARTYDSATQAWSALTEAEFIVGIPASSSNLVVSELHYSPGPPVGAAEAPYTAGDFEFIELQNISEGALEMTGVEIGGGISFEFSGSPITVLPPGGRVLVVKNRAAFDVRYAALNPATLLIAGEFIGALNNGGENITVTGFGGAVIRSFTYDNSPPWPPAADGTGPSLVLVDPNSNPDHSEPTNWRASGGPNGTPGGTDATNFATWLAAAGGSGTPSDDPDKDSLANLMEYALNGAPTVSSQAPLPKSAVQLVSVNGSVGQYLTITFTRLHTADDIDFAVEFATGMTGATWQRNGVVLTSTLNPNGTLTETWRAPTPINALTPKQFGRVKVTMP